MVIELSANMNRSTYFAGESITVSISIANIYQAINRYFHNSCSVTGIPTGVNPNITGPHSVSGITTSPYGSINGVPSINQIKNTQSNQNVISTLSPNSSMNVLSDAIDSHLQVTNDQNNNVNKKSNINQKNFQKTSSSSVGGLDNTSVVGGGKNTPSCRSPNVEQMVNSTNNNATNKLNSQNSKNNNLNAGSTSGRRNSHHNHHLAGHRNLNIHQQSLLKDNNINNCSNNLINTLATNCANNDSLNSERVAWISVYMHCECNVNRNKVALQNISAALAPVKSVFSHDFEGTNTGLQSHLFTDENELNPNSHNISNTENVSYANSTTGGYFNALKNATMKNSGDNDSGIGGLHPTKSNYNNALKNTSNSVNGRTLLPKTSLAPDRDSTGICVLQTPPQILLCDLTLKPGEDKKLTYREKIPVEAPPSYSGSLLKYSYKLTVSVQRVGGSIRQIKLPFRVLVLYGLSDYQGVEEIPLHTNPFLDRPFMDNNFKNYRDPKSNTNMHGHNIQSPNHPSNIHSENLDLTSSYNNYDESTPTVDELECFAHNSNLLDLASDLLNRITIKRRPLVYKIANSNGVVGTFCMPKTSYRLGEDVVGIFDFCGTVPCVQLEIALQMEEIVVDEFKKRNGQPNSVVTFHNQIIHCLFTKKQAIVVPIPLHVSPEFMTEIVILRWRLHFQFVTAQKPLEGQVLDDMAGDTMWQGPFNVKTNGMAWDLPIKVLPTVPALAEGATNSDKSATINF